MLSATAVPERVGGQSPRSQGADRSGLDEEQSCGDPGRGQSEQLGNGAAVSLELRAVVLDSGGQILGIGGVDVVRLEIDNIGRHRLTGVRQDYQAIDVATDDRVFQADRERFLAPHLPAGLSQPRTRSSTTNGLPT